MKYMILAVLMLTACVPAGESQTPTETTPNETTILTDFSKMDWTLNLVNGKPATYSATLNLGVKGQVSGQAPCNRYTASLNTQGGGFVLGPIAATRMACLQIEGEASFFNALAAVTTVETMPGQMQLSGGGQVLTFVQPIN